MPFDGGFGVLFVVIIVVSIVSAIVGLRTTWLSGSFMSRSRVDVKYDTPTATPTATAPPPAGKTVEARLTELKRLKDSGVIDDAEYASSRAAVLKDIAAG
ncbi:MAG: hypothetical protein QOG68_95 [Solirubrobacteraceae bacterium]|jgi:hypothetical protein|nr:hypothetical protein [Solirubrobacteraceae bacterium]